MPEESVVKSLFSDLATGYDRGNAVITIGQFQKWQETLASLCISLPPDRASATMLDVGCGSGDGINAVLARKRTIKRIVGVDFSLPMLEVAMKKLSAHRGAVTLLCSNALALPFEQETFDLVYSAFVLRNVASRKDALCEMVRTLKKGGYLVVMELSHPEKRTLRLFFRLYLNFVMPMLGTASSFFRGNTFSHFRYLYRTWKAFPDARKLKDEMEEVGLENLECMSLSGGIVCIHKGQKPYL
jgi:demethylmenaquinone methyltransferase/2-methoxy-6-polyprenyl-1,4-benzoquinol methylase